MPGSWGFAMGTAEVAMLSWKSRLALILLGAITVAASNGFFVPIGFYW